MKNRLIDFTVYQIGAFASIRARVCSQTVVVASSLDFLFQGMFLVENSLRDRNLC